MHELEIFEQAMEAFRTAPGQAAYSEMLNAFVIALAAKVDVQAVVVAEQDKNGALVRLRRLNAGEKRMFSFFTSAEKAKASGYHTDFVVMTLDKVLDQSLREPNITGLVVNPGEGNDVLLPRQVLMMAREAAKNMESINGSN